MELLEELDFSEDFFSEGLLSDLAVVAVLELSLESDFSELADFSELDEPLVELLAASRLSVR